MKTSKTWLALGWSAILALLYVGHGLREGARTASPLAWEQSVQAQENQAPKVTCERIGKDMYEGELSRVQVPDGWLIVTTFASWGTSLVFIPDTTHKEKLAPKVSFERIGEDTKGSVLWRAQIPGGWLVEIVSRTAKASLMFLPDAEHKWGVR